MGLRAHYVLVEEHGWTLYYSHWGGENIDRDLIWSPEHALGFIRAQARTTTWLKEFWCVGAALIDLPRRQLLIFGGDEACFDVALQRLELAVFEHLWPGWTARWALGGLGDLAEYVGLKREVVREEILGPTNDPVELKPQQPASLYSVRDAGGVLRLYPLSRPACEVCLQTPRVLDQLARIPDRPAMTLELSTDRGLRDGVHIDVRARTLDLWTATPFPSLSRLVAQRWPGWRFTHHGTDWRSQTERTGGAARFVEAPRAKVEAELFKRLTERGGVDPEQIRQSLLRSLPAKDVQFTAAFGQHVPLDLSQGSRAEALTRALCALREGPPDGPPDGAPDGPPEGPPDGAPSGAPWGAG